LSEEQKKVFQQAVEEGRSIFSTGNNNNNNKKKKKKNDNDNKKKKKNNNNEEKKVEFGGKYNDLSEEQKEVFQEAVEEGRSIFFTGNEQQQ